jgi:hypothetical protein
MKRSRSLILIFSSFFRLQGQLKRQFQIPFREWEAKRTGGNKIHKFLKLNKKVVLSCLDILFLCTC